MPNTASCGTSMRREHGSRARIAAFETVVDPIAAVDLARIEPDVAARHRERANGSTSTAGIVATTSGTAVGDERGGGRDVVDDDAGVGVVARGDDERAGADGDHDHGGHEQHACAEGRDRGAPGTASSRTCPYARSCCSRSIDIGDSQAVAQPGQRAVEVVAQRRYRAIENGRRIGIGEVVCVDEQHRSALLRRERGERGG